MARPLRVNLPDVTYHVTSRGNGRMDIYHDDADRRAFLRRLADVVGECRLACHAYCLMSNHYHLVVRTTDANLPAAVQQLNGAYAQWWNRRHGHVGHVFQGRFGAQIIQEDRYLLTACRYVVLNPVRAGMVAGPADWSWSSYRATAGLARCPPFLHPHAIWGYFAASSKEAAARFRRFAGETRPDSLPSAAVVGDEDFVERVQRIVCRTGGQTPERGSDPPNGV